MAGNTVFVSELLQQTSDEREGVVLANYRAAGSRGTASTAANAGFG